MLIELAGEIDKYMNCLDFDTRAMCNAYLDIKWGIFVSEKKNYGMILWSIRILYKYISNV